MESNWLVTTGLVTSSVITVIANLFLLLIFFRRRGLRTVPNRFVINLLITNLLSSLLLTPLLLIDQETQTVTHIINSGSSNDISISTTNNTSSIVTNTTIEQLEIIQEEEEEEEFIGTNLNSDKITIISENFLTPSLINDNNNNNSTANITTSTAYYNNPSVLCNFAQSSTSFVCTLSIFSILLIGINQYFGVIHSLRYNFYINKCRSMIFILTTWLVALVFGILTSITKNDSNLWHFCQLTSTTTTKPNNYIIRIFNTSYAFSYFIVIILAPIIAIFIIYVCIYTAAHKNSERMRKSTSANLDSNYYTPIASSGGRDEEGGLTLVIDEKEKKKTLPKVHSAPNFITHFDDDNNKTIGCGAAQNKIECDQIESNLNCELNNKVGCGLNHIVDYDQNHIVGCGLNNKAGCGRNNKLLGCGQTNNNNNNKVGRANSNGSNFITSLKHKISNASVFRYREETRAAKISVLVIFMVLICYLPYGLNLVLNSTLIGIKSKYFNDLSLILLIISNIISPFLFAYRNKRVKREIGKMFGLKVVPTIRTLTTTNRLMTVLPTNNNNNNNNSSRQSMRAHHHHHHHNRSCDDILNNETNNYDEPFLTVPEVIVEMENERKSILKRVCNTSNWTNYKKCNFIPVPDSCIGSGEARGSFSSASTQISNED